MSLFKKKDRCPNCQIVLDKRPSRKTKCKNCNKYIFIRSGNLFTEEQANIIDSLKMFGFSRDQYFEAEKQVMKKFGHQPKYRDVIWYICNQEILIHRDDWNYLSQLYYNMALFLNKHEKECFHILQQSRKAQLLYLKEMGIEEVEIHAIDRCPSCLKLDGKILKIDEALKQMPIPNKDCTNIRDDKKRSFCICQYWPTSEIVREARNKYE